MEELLNRLEKLSSDIASSGTQLSLLQECTLLVEGITYYQLRQFLTIIYKQISDKGLKGDILEILKVLTKLEVKSVPVPTIRKLKSISPEIFPDDKKETNNELE